MLSSLLSQSRYRSSGSKFWLSSTLSSEASSPILSSSPVLLSEYPMKSKMSWLTGSMLKTAAPTAALCLFRVGDLARNTQNAGQYGPGEGNCPTSTRSRTRRTRIRSREMPSRGRMDIVNFLSRSRNPQVVLAAFVCRMKKGNERKAMLKTLLLWLLPASTSHGLPLFPERMVVKRECHMWLRLSITTIKCEHWTLVLARRKPRELGYTCNRTREREDCFNETGVIAKNPQG